MSGFLEVLVGVTAGRGVATANVTADKALTQLYPAQSSVGASLADVAAGLYFGIRLRYVLAFRHKTSLLEQTFWMTKPALGIRVKQLTLRWSGITAVARPRVYNEILRRIHS
jgi:hypothetical protein